jgi:hypothetical protein
MTSRPSITPGEFQEICDRAVLAVDLQCWNGEGDTKRYAAALISEVHKGVCRQLGERYQGDNAVLSNERRIEALVGLVSQHWSGPYWSSVRLMRQLEWC